MADLQARIHRVLRPEPGDDAGRSIERLVTTLILLNVAAVIFETVGDNATRYAAPLHAFELFSLAAFSTEYVLRLWSSGADPRYAGLRGRLRWMATPLALIDLAAILPIFLPAADLRMLRVLRLLKLGRYSESARILGVVFRRRRQELAMSFSLVMLALLLASSLMYYLEREAQPDVFSSIPAAMWWGIVTLTTVGYGDVVPLTAGGKVVGAFAALVGILALALPVGILASGFTEEMAGRRKEEAACPHCGKPLPP